MISGKQYRKMKWLVRLNGTTGRDSGKYADMYKYLLSQDYIRKAEVRGYSGYVVTERGRAAMHAYKTDSFRFWFPSIISLLALAVSILSAVRE